MSDWQGKTRGGVWGHKFFVLLVRSFGLKPAYFFLRFVAIYFLIFSNKKHIYYFYHSICKQNFYKSIFSIYKNYCSLGQVLVDKVALLSGFSDSFTYNFDGEEYLRELKNGGILISAHLGSWEIAGQLLERIDTTFNIVMFDSEHEKIKEYLENIMVKKNFKVIVMKEDLSHIWEIHKALDNKELVCFHGDRFVEGSKYVSVDFLGVEANFPAGPFYLVSRFNVPVSFVFAFKETSTHYHFFATKARSYNFSNKISERNNNVMLVLKDYLTEFESKVQLFNLQWFNYHKFWNN